MNATLLRFAFLFASLLLFVPAGAPADPQAFVALRIGTTGGDAFAEPYYAEAMGFFRKAGLKPAISAFSSGAAVSAAVLSGAIDVGISNTSQLARSIAHGAPFVLIAGGGLYSSDSPVVALIGRRDSPIRTAKDLETRTIAITATGDLPQIGIMAWLDKNGADPTGVHFIELPFSDMEPALKSRIADAAIVAEPWLSAAVRSGSARVLAKPYDVIAPEFLNGVWFTTSAWYTKNPVAAKRFVVTIYDAARWANGHHDQSAKILARYSRMDLATIRSATRAPYATTLDAALLQPPIDLAYKLRLIDHPLDAGTLLAK